MKTVKVVNTGRRVRDRLGSRFLPNQEQTLEVNSRQYLTLKAVKDFKVEVIEKEQEHQKQEDNNENDNINTDNDDNDTNNSDIDTDSDNNTQDGQDNEELDYYELNIEEVLKAVQEGLYDVEEAIDLEVAGKSRVTLIEKLEEIKQGE